MKKKTIKNVAVSMAVIFGATYGIKICKNLKKKEVLVEENNKSTEPKRTYSTIAVLKKIKNKFEVKSINSKED